MRYHRFMDSAAPKLSRLAKESVVADDAPLESTEILEEMDAEWEQDWSEL
jgi:hypothetical protein